MEVAEFPLLLTKLNLPPLPSNPVLRPRLIERLDAALLSHKKLVLVSATAGFGKTTCLSQWCHRLIDEEPATVVWYTLDETDNEPARFAAYLQAGFAMIPGQSLPTQNTPTSLDSTVIRLLNYFAALPRRWMLVLDDYQVIATPVVHSAIGLLLEHLPPNGLVVISSRADPALQLSRLRVRDQLEELRAADLGFTKEEINGFFQQRFQLALPEPQIRMLEEWTEGWPAGLQLIAMSLSEAKSKPGTTEKALSHLSERLKAPGNQRYIFDYLTEEVYEQQPAELKSFLVETAVLWRLNAPLCQAVTGKIEASEILDRLNRANLFLTPLDKDANWFRYHHLWSEFLQERLAREQPAQSSELHRRAANWYIGQGLVVQGVAHALAADDFEKVAKIIEEFGYGLLAKGEFATLRYWQTRLPASLIHHRLPVALILAQAHFLSGQSKAAEELLQGLELDQAQPNDNVQMKALKGTLAACRALEATLNGKSSEAMQLAKEALALLPEQSYGLRAHVLFSQAGYYHMQGELDQARPVYEECCRVAQAAGNEVLELSATAALIRLEFSLGHLNGAIRRCREKLDSIAPGPASCNLYALLADMLYEQNSLVEAETMLKQGLALAEQGGLFYSLLHLKVSLARVEQAHGNYEQAETLIEAMLIAAQEHHNQLLLLYTQTFQVRLWLAINQLEPARKWAIQYQALPSIGFEQEFMELTVVRVWLVAGRIAEAQELLHRYLQKAAGKKLVRLEIELLVLQALAFHAQNQTALALTALNKALTRAEPEGFSRIFLDEGPAMLHLLKEAYTHQISPNYVLRLLAATQEEEITSVTAGSELPGGEKMTGRELEVLHLIAQGASNREIATQLVLSLGTVKAHTAHLMSKLGARNRTEAVVLARKAGLIAE